VKLSRAQRDVLMKLSQGWVLDAAGKDGMQGWMSYDGTSERRVSAKTITLLLNDELIGRDHERRIQTWVITSKGLSALKGL
jgi:hypothetical protein